MTCPTCYVNSTPEHVPVTINNNAITIEMPADTEVQWVVDRFVLADSVGDAGLVFFLSKVALLADEVQVFLDNVPQEGKGVSFSVGLAKDRVTLVAAMEAGSVLLVRYLAYVSTSIWATETFHIGDSADGDGEEFTLAETPAAAATTAVIRNGVALTYTALATPGPTEFTFTGTALKIGTALTAGMPLVVTYAYT